MIQWILNWKISVILFLVWEKIQMQLDWMKIIFSLSVWVLCLSQSQKNEFVLVNYLTDFGEICLTGFLSIKVLLLRGAFLRFLWEYRKKRFFWTNSRALCGIQLRKNLWLKKGLVNGAIGTVVDIIDEEIWRLSLPLNVLVKFDNYTVTLLPNETS